MDIKAWLHVTGEVVRRAPQTRARPVLAAHVVVMGLFAVAISGPHAQQYELVGPELGADAFPRIDINVAGADELALLPGLGPTLAARVIEYRSEHGRFQHIQELAQVSGVGPKTVARVQDFVCLSSSQ